MFHRSSAIAAIAAACALAGASACEKTDHDNIDKWTHTQKGPDKLKAAFLDESLDPDLSAHAATNMLKTGKDGDVRAGFETLSASRRTQVIAKLAPRLWELARVERETDLPRGDQIGAKDLLFAIRKYADPEETKQIDGYLIDWYCVESYEGRANGGGNTGPKVLRAIGAPAAKKLVSVVNGIVAKPRNRIGDGILVALAAVGTAETVKYVLDIAKMDRGDKTLANRALDALEIAFVKNDALFDLVPPDALAANIGPLSEIVKDEKMPAHAANDAVDLIRAAGAPVCLKPLMDMIGYPHKDEAFTYMAVQNALVCGGAKSIVEIVKAIPDGSYDLLAVQGAFSGPLVKLTPQSAVLTALRELADEKKPIARWIAIEGFAALKSKEDKARVEAVGKDTTKLVGYWGDQSNVDPGQRKTDPTLGARAKEIAAAL